MWHPTVCNPYMEEDRMEKKRVKDLTDLQRGWLQHLKESTTSGMSRRRYAKAHGLNYSTFEKMRHRLVRLGVWNEPEPVAPSVPVFQKVPVSMPTSRSGPVRVICPNGVEVQIAGGLDAAGLRELLSVVVALS
ncbi:MAG: hypothetical protein HQL67_02705 [Magnetococcales bacterium]|nr:hypothetical protein [Magnetococcales bacterium]